MTLEEIKGKTANDGKYKSITYKVEKKNGYSKITKGVYRFAKYSKMKNGNPSATLRPTETMIFDNVIQNSNTGSVLVQLAITHNPKLKAKSTYYLNGNEITKEEYEQANPSKGTFTDSVFRVRLENIIAIA